jgi:hypothetical protein
MGTLGSFPGAPHAQGHHANLGMLYEAVKERDTLITQIQEMEEKDQSKVIPWLVDNAFWDFYTSKNNFVVHNPIYMIVFFNCS